MRIPIENYAQISGDYEDDVLSVTSTIALTEIINGLSATKTASKAFWTGGTMTYTILISNTSGEDYEDPVLTDTLDSRLTLVADSVKVGGVARPYTFENATLSVALDTIPDAGSVTVTFDVKEV